MTSREPRSTGGKPRLVLNQRVCDRCGRCVQACDKSAVRVGRTYLAVDWARCDGCGACVRVCAPGAITPGKGGPAPARARAPKPVARPRTGGRAADSSAAETGARSRKARATGSEVQPTDEQAQHADGAVQASEAAGQATLAAVSTQAVPVRRPPRASTTTAKAPKAVAAPSAAPGASAAGAGSRGGFQWTLLEAVAMLSVTFSAFMVKELVNASAVMNGLSAGLGIAARVAVLAAYYAIQVAVLVWLVRRRGGEPVAALGLRISGASRRTALISAWMVVAGLVVTRLVASLYAYTTRELGMMPSGSVDLRALFGSNTVGVLLAVLMVVLIGPAVEEAVFRGALLEGLSARFGTWPAILAQAALFAAFHRSWWLLFPTFVLGIVLGWLAHERQSLWPPIALHALYNALTVAAAFVVPITS